MVAVSNDPVNAKKLPQYVATITGNEFTFRPKKIYLPIII